MNNTTLIFIVGLPRSGKTTLSFLFQKYIKNCIVIDDIKTYKQVYKELKNKPLYLIINSPFLCFEKDRERYKNEFKQYNQKWIYFENNLQQCKINAIIDKKNVLNEIEFFSNNYFPPNKTIKVFKI